MRDASSPKRACRRGDTIANAYTLREVLGVGGMGVVFAADLDDGQSVAIKLLPLEHATNPRATRRLRDEASAARYVSHPNVVSVLDVSEPGAPIAFLVMERVPGVQLSRLLKGKVMPLRRAANIACEILAGLDAIHAAGVVHGDIKTSNILVERTSDGCDAVKIIDFGLATLHRSGQVPVPEYDAGGVLLMAGTPEYMAPEVIRGSGAVAASDLYGVAVIMYQMITGRTPFRGGPAAAVLARHLNDHVVSPSLHSPERSIPHELERAILRGLEKEPSARFPTAAAFAAALDAATPAAEPAPLKLAGNDEPSMCLFTTEAATRVLPRRAGNLLVGTLAAGTPSLSSTELRRLRISLHAELERGADDAAVVTSLKIARALVDARHLKMAIGEIEATVRQLRSSPPLWRLLLTLASLYQGVGDRTRARQTAAAAHRDATAHRSAVGCERSATLVNRLAA